MASSKCNSRDIKKWRPAKRWKLDKLLLNHLLTPQEMQFLLNEDVTKTFSREQEEALRQRFNNKFKNDTRIISYLRNKCNDIFRLGMGEDYLGAFFLLDFFYINQFKSTQTTKVTKIQSKKSREPKSSPVKIRSRSKRR